MNILEHIENQLFYHFIIVPVKIMKSLSAK